MSPIPYALLTPITITKRTAGRDGTPDKVETRDVAEFKRKSIGGAMYFANGDVNFIATSNGGTTFEVELDEVIETYIRFQIDDPDADLIFDALKLADAMALRQEMVDQFAEATAAARAARTDADPETVKLIHPFTVHDELVREVKLSEPTHRDFARLGRPFTWSRTSDGAVQPTERMTVIRKYLGRCITHDLGDMTLGYLDLADAMQLKRAMLAFFTRAAVTANGAKSSTPSSSTEDTSSSTPATP